MGIAATEKPVILVVDDEPDTLIIVQMNLQFAGFDVVLAADGQTGLDLAHQRQPDLVVLNVRMPVMDGWAVLRELRSDPAFAAMPIMMLTTDTRPRSVISALSMGADEYVSKPFAPHDLVEVVGRLLDTPPDERASRREREMERCIAEESEEEAAEPAPRHWWSPWGRVTNWLLGPRSATKASEPKAPQSVKPMLQG